MGEFKKIASPTIKGSTNPDDAELGIEEMEKASDATHSSEQNKIRFGAYLLHGSVNNWWKGFVRTHAKDPGFFTWNNFRTAFIQSISLGASCDCWKENFSI